MILRTNLNSLDRSYLSSLAINTGLMDVMTEWIAYGWTFHLSLKRCKVRTCFCYYLYCQGHVNVGFKDDDDGMADFDAEDTEDKSFIARFQVWNTIHVLFIPYFYFLHTSNTNPLLYMLYARVVPVCVQSLVVLILYLWRQKQLLMAFVPAVPPWAGISRSIWWFWGVPSHLWTVPWKERWRRWRWLPQSSWQIQGLYFACVPWLLKG